MFELVLIGVGGGTFFLFFFFAVRSEVGVVVDGLVFRVIVVFFFLILCNDEVEEFGLFVFVDFREDFGLGFGEIFGLFLLFIELKN